MTRVVPRSDSSWVADMPAIYDRHLGPVFFAPFGQYLAERLAPLAPRRVLEIAAGTGRVTAALVDALPDAEVVATDLNPAMVSHGATQVPGASWQQADALALPFADGSFDAVVCSFGVMFFPDRVRGLAEIARVLAPAGTALLTTWDSVETHPFAHAVVQALQGIHPEDPPTFVVRVPHGYHDPARIEADARAAGLGSVTVEPVELSGTATSARDVAVGLCTGSPLRAALEARGDLSGTTELVATSTEALLGAGPVTAIMRAYVVCAAKAWTEA